MSRLLFTKTYKVQQHDGKGPLYEAGKVYDFDGFVAGTYAAKYKRLGLAVDAPIEEPSGRILNHIRNGEEPMTVLEEDFSEERAQAVAEADALIEEVLSQPKRRGRPPRNA